MGKPYILCVDDDKTILMSLKAQIRHHYGTKYNVELAESAEEGWEVIQELTEEGEHIYLVISDWLMPKVKGEQFLIELHKKYPNIVKIILTGQADDEAIINAKKSASLACCLAKPWSKQELFEVIDNFQTISNKVKHSKQL